VRHHTLALAGRDVAGTDGAVAVPVGVWVVARLADPLLDGVLRDGGVGAVDLAVAVDVLRGQVPRLAVGVVGDAEGEGAGAADRRHDRGDRREPNVAGAG
jgi:hypothetical protein